VPNSEIYTHIAPGLLNINKVLHNFWCSAGRAS